MSDPVTRRNRRGAAAKISVLRTVPLFARATPRALERIISLVDEVELPAGTVLMREGTPANEAFVIVSGAACVTLRGRLLATLGPGALFGEIGLADGHPRSATVQTTEPSMLLVVSRMGFDAIFDACPAARREILATVATRLRRYQDGFGGRHRRYTGDRHRTASTDVA